MLNAAKTAARQLAARAGARVIRLENDPEHRLCGLLNLPIRTVLDIGANRGSSAHRFMRQFPAAKIASFEPQPEPYRALERLATESCGRVQAFNVALGAGSGTVEMLQHVDHDTSSSLLSTTDTAQSIYPFVKRQTKIKVELVRLDDIVPRIGFDLVDDVLVKVDVQGYEAQVLEGGPHTLQRAAAAIVEISLVPLYDGQPTMRDIVDQLDYVGLRFAGCLSQFLDDAGNVVFIDAVFRRTMPIN